MDVARLDQLADQRDLAEKLCAGHLSALWEFRVEGSDGRSLERLPEDAVSLPMFRRLGVPREQRDGDIRATCAAVRSILRNPTVQLGNLRPLILAAELLHRVAMASIATNEPESASHQSMSLIELAQLAHVTRLLSNAIGPFAEQKLEARDFNRTGYDTMGSAGRLLKELQSQTLAQPADVLSVVEVGCAEQAARDVETLRTSADDWQVVAHRVRYSIRRLHRVGKMRAAVTGSDLLSDRALEDTLSYLVAADSRDAALKAFDDSNEATGEFAAWWLEETADLEILANPDAYLSEFISARYVLEQVTELCLRGIDSGLALPQAAPTFLDVRVDEHTPPHPFVLYWLLQALTANPERYPRELREAVATSAQEEYFRLVARASAEAESIDMVRLGFHLSIDLAFSPTPDRAIAKAAARALVSQQRSNGDWPKGGRLWVSRDVGDTYCSAVEVMASLLPSSKLFGELGDLFDACGRRTLRWLAEHSQSPGSSTAWMSPQSSTGECTEAVYTAEAYSFLHSMTDYYNGRIVDLALEVFKGNRSKVDERALGSLRAVIGDIRRGQTESRILESTGEVIDVTVAEPIGNVLAERIVKPLETAPGSGTYALAARADRGRKLRSGILYGPPGTGKTTLVKRIAQALGWPYLQLGPSDFMVPTTEHFPSAAASVFHFLSKLRDCVILLDEMDELLRTREPRSHWERKDFLRAGQIDDLLVREADHSDHEPSSRTTMMLPYLQDLHDDANAIFVVATNYFDRVDPAAARPGRFDFRLQVLPPSAPAKIDRILVPLVKRSLALGPQATDILSQYCYSILCKNGMYAIYKGGFSPRQYKLVESMEAERRGRGEVDDGWYLEHWSIFSAQGDVAKPAFPVSEFFEYFTLANTEKMAESLSRDPLMARFDSWSPDETCGDRLPSVILRALSAVSPAFFDWDRSKDMLEWSQLGPAL